MRNSIVIVFVCLYINIVLSSFCYWNTACSYRFFSTKTPYSAVRGDIRDSNIKIKECEPVSIWGIFRHGKTYPGIKSAARMKSAIAIRDLVISSFEDGRCSLCAQDIDNLRDWPVNREMFEKTNALQDEGYREMLGIGERLKQVYPKLFNNLEGKNYLFRPTRHHWVKDSTKAFVKGLGSGNLAIDDSNGDLDFMNPQNSHDEEDPISSAEANQYIISSDYLAARDRLQRRLGIDYTLSDDNITALYDLCRYTWSGLDNRGSPWCALFTTEDLKVLEYIGDLQQYYEYGYGRSDATIVGLMPLVDLLENFQKAKMGEGRKITAYFTEAVTLDVTFTTLGWFKDDHPLAVTQKDRDRYWRTSKHSVLSANLFLVLNRCTNKSANDYHVMFYMNEEPLRSVCEGGICSWREFEKKLLPFLNATRQ